MSREITISTPRLPASPDDLWYQGGAMSVQQAQQQPLKKIHKLLRGRYILAIVLVTIGAVTGAAIGYLTQVPLFQSNGLIEINPTVTTGLTAEKGLPYYTNFVRSQASIIRSQWVLQDAVKRREWTATGQRGAGPEAIASYASRLNAEHIRDTSLIRVSFTDPDPKRAQAGVNAAIEAYMHVQQDVNNQSMQERLRQAEDQRADWLRQYNAAQQNIHTLSSKFGTQDLSPMHNMMLTEITALKMRLNRLEFARRAMEAAFEQADADDPDAQRVLSVVELAKADPQVGELYSQQVAQVAELNRLIRTQGSQHRMVLNAQQDLQDTSAALQAAVEEARKRIIDVQPSVTGTGDIIVTQQTLNSLRLQEKAAQHELVALQGDATVMGNLRQEIQKLTDEMTTLSMQLENVDKHIESLKWQMAVKGHIQVRGYGDTPIAPAVDRRKQFALVGFVGGGGIPLALLLLIGLLDSRYRYSDDAGSSGVSGLTLLGILPNLPDRLSDPGQASIAAHCVHQIRTMLQINTSEDRRAFTVTSSSSGDGKTSLTLALGLSFAASGSRTLLIDADLVGAGLTARLNMNGPEGILEAINNRDLLSYARTTDIADLSILPVGMAQLHHAGIFSPAAVRRLINEAKKHFEIILIDTGPILGSIEATPVCAACDGVILTVARGQQRPLVEKALDHLRSIGARMAGIVFNRAMARDFEQSVSGISLRSASRSANGNGKSHNRDSAGQYGPVARAVASSVKTTDGIDTN